MAKRRQRQHLSDEKLKQALRKFYRTLIKLITEQQPFSFIALTDSIKTSSGKTLTSYSDGIKSLRRILVTHGVIVMVKRGRYVWALNHKAKIGKTISEAVDSLFKWVKSYNSTNKGLDGYDDRDFDVKHITQPNTDVITEDTSTVEAMRIIHGHNYLVMPNERAALVSIMRVYRQRSDDPVTLLAIERLLTIFEKPEEPISSTKLLTNG